MRDELIDYNLRIQPSNFYIDVLLALQVDEVPISKNHRTFVHKNNIRLLNYFQRMNGHQNEQLIDRHYEIISHKLNKDIS